MSEETVPFPLMQWIADHAEEFVPPVSNRVIWPDSDITFMIIRGPNARNDFHVNPTDEIFYQLRGTIRVDVRDDEGVHQRLVHEGDVMLVPAGTPHAPLRPADTWGLVLEVPRPPDALDRMQWYCPACDHLLHEVSFDLADIETELAVALDRVNADEELRTCERCGTVLPVPGPFELDA